MIYYLGVLMTAKIEDVFPPSVGWLTLVRVIHLILCCAASIFLIVSLTSGNAFK